MKKYIVIITAAVLFLISCTSEKKVMDSWVGDNKQHLIMTWGPPARITSDGNDGEIYIYSSETYMPYYNITRYNYRMFFLDKEGAIYHWITQSGAVPPQQINVTHFYR